MKHRLLLFSLAILCSCNVIDRVEQATEKDNKLKYSNRTIRSLQAELKGDTRKAIQQLGTKEARERADELFELEAYEMAYYYYDYVNSKRPLDKAAAYRLGVASLAVRDYDKAQENLKFYIDKKNYQDARYHYALSLMHLNEYERAIQQFDKYIEAAKDKNTETYKLAVQYRDGATFAVNPRNSGFSIDRLYSNVNSGFTETSPTQMPDGRLLYTHFDKNSKSTILQVRPDGIDEAQPITALVNKSEFINKDPLISPDGQAFYFTRCYYGDLPECGIYRAEITPNGDIVNPRKLSENINLPGFSSMHATISVNDYGQEILYFSSDRPGGYGGLDIWFSIRLTDGKFTRAYNCGARINGDFDEVTPYYDAGEGLIYYSSNHPETMGGFDVFKAKGEKKYWSKPTSVGVPINSSCDDYYFKLEPDTGGYLVSNRNGAPFADYQNCCDDIYRVE